MRSRIWFNDGFNNKSNFCKLFIIALYLYDLIFIDARLASLRKGFETEL